jgi:hypothetical protein
VASILASKVSERTGVPALLVFLAIGMLAGSDGLGGIYFDNARAANFVGTFALAFVIFSDRWAGGPVHVAGGGFPLPRSTAAGRHRCFPRRCGGVLRAQVPRGKPKGKTQTSAGVREREQCSHGGVPNHGSDWGLVPCSTACG